MATLLAGAVIRGQASGAFSSTLDEKAVSKFLLCIMQGLRVQKTKREGKLYAQGMLEDATGKIELIAFPRDYEKLSEQLKIEAFDSAGQSIFGSMDQMIAAL